MTRTSPGVLRSACEMLDMSFPQLWAHYVAIGGNLAPAVLEAFLLSGEGIDDHDFNLIVQAINDCFIGRNQVHRLPYADDPPLDSLLPLTPP